jgi:cytochrome c oxidase cbb3-type subunit 4
MDYQQLRHLADSWGLLFMVLTMIAIVGWTFRPGARGAHDDARMIPLRDDEAEQ